ncbi:MAG: DUF4252 domain-containing protein [Bacteroidales bacterium]|nr:DUF4252 domain-containing protein [Bacteroidales bacterium]
MKTTIRTTLVLFMLVPFLAMAQYQSPAEKAYQKYAGKEGFTSVNITKELFEMIMKMEIDGKGTEKVKEVQEMMEQLTGLRVLTYENDENPEKVKSLYKEFNALFPASDYTELMSVQENGSNIRFLTKQEDNGKILEMVMLAEEDDHEVTLLSLVGHIDMSTISKLSGTMKIHGMDKLEKVNKENDD